MIADDLALGQTLGPGRADVVRVENLKRVGTGVTHQTTDADNNQSEGGQDEVLGNIKELSRRGEQMIVAAHHAADVKPPEFDGKDQF